jgi:hypothetical protein
MRDRKCWFSLVWANKNGKIQVSLHFGTNNCRRALNRRLRKNGLPRFVIIWDHSSNFVHFMAERSWGGGGWTPYWFGARPGTDMNAYLAKCGIAREHA